MKPLITLENVCLDYPIYNSSAHSLKKKFLMGATGGLIKEDPNDKILIVNGLKNISINIYQGDKIGLIGHNGLGKTSLLRLLSQIYFPTSGPINTFGSSIASLIDLSLGIDPEATGRQNLYIRASLLGVPKYQIEHIVQSAIIFSELGDFVDLLFRTYSSGMQLRLAFSIATSITPDILIMDEWLSAGDKLEKAIQKLDQGYDCYSSNVEAFWADGKRKVLVKNQPQQKFDYLFESAGPGCTFVFSKKLATSLRVFLKNNQVSLSEMCQYHDWLIYAFARSNNFKWFIDSYVSMQYRQHAFNDFGANVGLFAFLVRFKKIINGDGFDQVLRLIKIFKLENDSFVKKWYPLSRIRFIKLALHASKCRRRLREKIYFFLACILLSIILPKKLRTI